MAELAIQDNKDVPVQSHLKGRDCVLKGKQKPTSVYEGEPFGLP